MDYSPDLGIGVFIRMAEDGSDYALSSAPPSAKRQRMVPHQRIKTPIMLGQATAASLQKTQRIHA